VTDRLRHYRYIGPAELLPAQPVNRGQPIRSPDDLATWLSMRTGEELAEPFTFVIDREGTLRLAPRRSEHVACAAGDPVLSAGEIAFSRDQVHWAVSQVSNQSTGYCPDPASWPAVNNALDRAGLAHPDHFTDPIVFRRCPRCHERNLVKDDYFSCAVCDAELPRTWNLDSLQEPAADQLPNPTPKPQGHT
jgi:hypothetical protein